MRLKFIGDPIEHAQAEERGQGISRTSIRVGGVHFPLNVPVDASALPPNVLAKLAKNSHFEVVEGDGATGDEEAAEPASSPAPAPRAGQKRGTVKAKE